MSNVNHPQHYGGEDDPYEVVKVAEAWGFDKNAYLFNVLKYIRREKGHTLEDLKKARWYLDRLIGRLENTEPTVQELEVAMKEKATRKLHEAWGEGEKQEARHWLADEIHKGTITGASWHGGGRD